MRGAPDAPRAPQELNKDFAKSHTLADLATHFKTTPGGIKVRARRVLPRFPPLRALRPCAARAQTAMTKREITACKDMVKRDDKWESLVK